MSRTFSNEAFSFFYKTQINIHKFYYVACVGFVIHQEYVICICWNKYIFSRIFCFRSCGWGPFIEETCLKLWKSVELRWDQQRKDVLFYSWLENVRFSLSQPNQNTYIQHTLPEISNILSKSNTGNSYKWMNNKTFILQHVRCYKQNYLFIFCSFIFLL